MNESDGILGGRQYADGNLSTIDEWTDWVKFILDAAWGAGWGEFTIENPIETNPEDVHLPIITYELAHRKPSDSIRGIKPRAMEIVPDPDIPNHKITVYRQWFDCLIDFHVWHKTNREAELLKNQLEDLMLGYSGFFKQKGVSEILFLEENPPDVSTKWRLDIPRRTLRYFVRLEKITPVREIDIQRLATVVDVAMQLPPSTPPQSEIWIDPQTENSPFLRLYQHYYPQS